MAMHASMRACKGHVRIAWPSAPLNGHQRPSAAISGYQRLSEAITCNIIFSPKRERGWPSVAACRKAASRLVWSGSARRSALNLEETRKPTKRWRKASTCGRGRRGEHVHVEANEEMEEGEHLDDDHQ